MKMLIIMAIDDPQRNEEVCDYTCLEASHVGQMLSVMGYRFTKLGGEFSIVTSTIPNEVSCANAIADQIRITIEDMRHLLGNDKIEALTNELSETEFKKIRINTRRSQVCKDELLWHDNYAGFNASLVKKSLDEYYSNKDTVVMVTNKKSAISLTRRYRDAFPDLSMVNNIYDAAFRSGDCITINLEAKEVRLKINDLNVF